MVRVVLVPGRCIRLAISAGGHIRKRLDKMSKLTRLQKYHLGYAPRRSLKVVAESPAALEIERRAISREERGQFRLASRLWLECLDAAQTEVERARIAIRREQCITKSMKLRRGEYNGIGCRGVVYD